MIIWFINILRLKSFAMKPELKVFVRLVSWIFENDKIGMKEINSKNLTNYELVNCKIIF